MTPNEIAKSNTEDAHQAALFAWAAVARNHGFDAANTWAETGVLKHNPAKAVPELEWLHHIPNGGSRGDDAKSRMIRGAQLKRQGVKSGISDIFLPVTVSVGNGRYAGLYIEMKKPEARTKGGRKGGLTEEQILFLDFAEAEGYKTSVCYSWEEAANVIENYLKSRISKC